MKNKITYLVLLLLFLTATTSILAQEECGTELTQVQIDYMNATREARKNVNLSQLKSNTVTIIPMVAHIIRDDNGEGGLSTADLNIGMIDLNRAFEQANFEFDLCEINYIDNTAYTSIEKSFEEGSEEYQMGSNRVAGKVNVFFIENIDGCGWANFPAYAATFNKDWVVMSNECTVNSSTLPHELGHWFNLYHTHQGASDWLDITEAELVDGSNCGPNVGDELCDTPADPNLPFYCVDRHCAYTCDLVDTNGDAYAPNPTNLMSYGQRACRTFLSPQQIARIQTSYEFDRSGSLSPCTTSLDCEITSISVNNTTACNDNGTPNDMTDDYFLGEVTVNYLGTPDIGILYLSVVDYNLTYATSLFSGNQHVFPTVKMPANGQAVAITAYFSGQADCTFTEDNVHAGRNCGACDISNIKHDKSSYDTCNDNGTPNDATDDFFVVNVDVYYEEQPTSGHLIVEGSGVSLSVPVNQLSYDDTYYRFYDVSLPANGTSLPLTAKFSTKPSCSLSRNLSGMPACSIDGICDGETLTTGGSVRGKRVREVSNSITAFSKIEYGADVTYKAGERIILTSGFRAKKYSKFHAYIEDCTTDEAGNKEEIIDNGPILLRNYPNPFTEQTTIEFKLTKDTPVTLFVSDLTGRQIAVLLDNDQKTEGTHTVTFDGNHYPAGMYYYTIQAGEYYGTQKMILAK